MVSKVRRASRVWAKAPRRARPGPETGDGLIHGDHQRGDLARVTSTRARSWSWLGNPATFGLREQPRWSVLWILLAVDFTLIAAHIVNAVTVKQRLLYINLEFGLGESFQYAKFLTVVVVMVVLARRLHRAGPALWGLVFLYLAADDALAIHEAVGRALAGRWDLAEGAIVSQVAAGLVVGLAVLILATLAYRVSGLRRRVSAVFGVGLIGLGLFGVGVDGIHGLPAVADNRWLNVGVRLIEEGGEMLVASFLVAFALLVVRDAGALPGSELTRGGTGLR